MGREFRIGDRWIGAGHGCFLIAEMSANHNGDIERAKEIIRLAKRSGADAIKLQTYTADTMTIPSDEPLFTIEGGLWDGYTLYDLYQEASTPWEWHEELFAVAREMGILCFSTPFDATAVDFLERLDPPCYKLASFEAADLPLIEKIGATGRPVIMSTGMADLKEIHEAVTAFRDAGVSDLAVLRCVSSYPADPSDFNLATIPHLAETFDVVSGLSDHSMGHTVAVASVVLGARIIEKHFIRQRSDGGPDAAFSMEPAEFAQMVQAVRQTEAAVGKVQYGAGLNEVPNVVFRRSCFVVKDVAEGEAFTADSVRVIRPGHGLAPKHVRRIIGRKATRSVRRGTPLSWDLVGGEAQ